MTSNTLSNTTLTPSFTPTLKRVAALVVLTLILDQASKLWIVSHFALFDSLALTSFFNVVRAHNTGAAFSFLANAGGWQQVFFTLLAALVCTYLTWQMRTHPNDKRLCTAYGLVISGAIGNVIDRLRLGYVVDFLDVYIGGYHWPAFNVADSAICLGAALLMWDEMSKLRATKKPICAQDDSAKQ
jgi:signal peptidase II